ncbi:MAG: dihydroneopterin aldolase [Candidatus Omnitrophica bacterium CG11_big_fil_rev_8_21_14_0_20_63_9]|nr:MAG: dihydroneopterin aldolase [Candidatus Omnitrophica bacterium CG11_big_fil_rev_8_21_14_0_20_63_9]
MPDRLIISDLEAQCRIGVFEWERAQPQPIWIDLELPIDAARAAERESVEDTVDYARLVQAVKRVAEERTYRLMETLAEAVAQAVVQEFAPRVSVRVKKRALPGIAYAAVEVERVGQRRARVARRRVRGRVGRR